MVKKKRFHIVFSIATLLWMLGCGDKIEPGNVQPGQPIGIQARVAEAKMAKRPLIYEAVGTVSAQTASTLSSKLMGTVLSVEVKEGDDVKEGDVLLVLDQRQVTASLQNAEASIAEARRAEASARSARDAASAQAELARATYERYLNLMKDESASRQEFDEISARHRQAQAVLDQTTAMVEAAGARVQQAEAAVATAKVGKNDATIRAPYDAKITAKMVNQGDLASPGTPFLMLEKKGLYCADLLLPERHIQSVALDQKVRVVIPALSNKIMEGRIGRIFPAADQRSRSFQVKVALPEDSEVRSGMFARVEIPVGEAGMLLIPASAVIHQGQLTGFYLVDDQQIARFRLIRTGKRFGELVEVVSGIKEGDRYVVSPPPQLVDGARVEVAS